MSPTPESGNGWYRYRFDDVVYDEDLGRLAVAGVAAPVERKPLLVLSELLRRVGELCTRDELLAAVWPEEADSEGLSWNVLPMAVSKLRAAMGPAGRQRLQTVKSSQNAQVEGGYRLIGPVERTLLRRDLAQRLALEPGQGVPGRAPYRLQRPLDAAGRVWLASHPDTGDRRVFKFCADAAQLSALKREYTLQRVLSRALPGHPGLVPVVHVRFDEEPFWIEMPDAGTHLAEWAAQGHLAALSPDERLALFLPLVACVQDAHGVGVLHKDIKPANILVSRRDDGGWQLRLADFGSGRLLDRDTLARLQLSGQGLTVTTAVEQDSGTGTLMYLAPEVLAGQSPTVQSDVYALGLVLYQWLVGDFGASVLPGWEQGIDDPLLREDIAAATQRDPDQRMASVAQWRERLQALDERRLAARQAAQAQAHQQVLAASHARLQARRPWMLATLATLSLGLAVSVWMAVRAEQARASALTQAARSDSLNTFLTQDLLRSLDISRAGDAQRLSMVDALRQASARAGLRFAQRPDDEIAVRLQLYRTFHSMLELAPAEQELQRALTLMSSRRAPDDVELMQARWHRVGLLALSGRVPEAQSQLQGLDQAAQAASAASAAGPAVPPALRLAEVRARLALAHARMDYSEAVLALHRETLPLQAQAYPGDLATAHIVRREGADVLFRRGLLAEATQWLQEALAAPYTAEQVGVVTHARTRLQLAKVLIAQGQLDAALPEATTARQAMVKVMGPQDAWVAMASGVLGEIHAQQGRMAQAREENQAALQVFITTLGEQHPNVRLTRLNLAVLDLALGDAERALATLDRERPWFLQRFGSAQSPPVQGIDFFRASALTTLRRPAEALPLLSALSVEALTASSPAKDWRWRLQGEKGRALLLTGQASEGRALLGEVVREMTALDSSPWLRAPYEQALKG